MLENNGKKIAAILGVASCFPVVATAYAMQTGQQRVSEPYVTMDTIKDSLQDIECLSYFFDESIQAENVTFKQTLTVVNATKKTLQEESDSLIEDVLQTIEEQQETESDVVEEIVAEEEVIQIEEVSMEEIPIEEIVEPIVEEEIYEEDIYAPVQELTYENYVVEEEPIQQFIPQVEETYVEPEISSNPYDSLNANIASSAQSLVGVTDGQWCTQVVQEALALAGVQDAYQLWPDQYADMYGYYTDTPEAGNLVYYYNGGRGVDHIAVYIGNGMAVHGNYGTGDEMGKTVIAPVIINGGAPQYIQVCR